MALDVYGPARLVVGLTLLLAATSRSATPPTRAAAGAPAALAGGASDAAGDGPTGADLDSLRVGYDGAAGLLTATVTLRGASLKPGTIVSVAYGSSDPTGQCDTSSGPRVTFDAAEGAATWTLGGRATRGVAITRLVPVPTTTMSSAIASAALRRRPIACAFAETSSPTGPVPLDTSPTAELAPAASIVAPLAGDPTTLQLDYSYDARLPTKAGTADVRVVCLTASTTVCHGRLALEQQSTHIALGAATLALPLGRPSTVRVPIRLTAVMRRRPVVFAVARLASSPARVATGVLRLTR